MSARKKPGVRHYLIWLGCGSGILAAASALGAGSGVAYRKVVLGGIPVHVVQADLNRKSVRVTIGLSKRGIGHAEPWPRMIGRMQPLAAVTGTYYDIPTAIPVGTICIRGNTVHRGRVGTALAINRKNRAALVSCWPGQRDNWSHYSSVVRAGPRLLNHGRVALAPRKEGFRDRAIMASVPRTATGVTRHNKLLLVAVTHPITVQKMAAIMRHLGARDAMCMDGGNSAGLYYRGRSYVVPHRPMTNMVMIYEARNRHYKMAQGRVKKGA